MAWRLSSPATRTYLTATQAYNLTSKTARYAWSMTMAPTRETAIYLSYSSFRWPADLESLPRVSYSARPTSACARSAACTTRFPSPAQPPFVAVTSHRLTHTSHLTHPVSNSRHKGQVTPMRRALRAFTRATPPPRARHSPSVSTDGRMMNARQNAPSTGSRNLGSTVHRAGRMGGFAAS